MIDGNTRLIAHIGYPTHAFKAPLIYNPWFEQSGVNVVVVPMGCKAENFPEFLKCLFKLSNIQGALITMPHKVRVKDLVDELLPTAQIAGACNAVRIGSKGQLQGEMFDGEGFVRGLRNRGLTLKGVRALIVGCGGVGSAIAASLAAAGADCLKLFDSSPVSALDLASRLQVHFPKLRILQQDNSPEGCGLVVNATPLGMLDDDPLPMNVAAISPSSFVGEVVMREKITPFLHACIAKGCRVQIGLDMLFEQIPAYLEFFNLPVASSGVLRRLSKLPE